MNIAQHIEQGRRLFPERLALLFESETFTYQQLDELSSRVAHGLAGLNIARGDRVALLLPNHPAFVISYLAILKLGAIVVAINPALKTEEVTFILNDSGARVVITTRLLRTQVCEALLLHLAYIFIAEGECVGEPTLAELIRLDSTVTYPVEMTAVDMQADDPAAILYTSGTTGFPKGAVLSHGNVLSNGQACVDSFGLRSTDRVLLCLPVFHCFGQNAAMNPCFAASATLVLQRQFEVDAVLRAFSEQAITIFFGVPTLYLLLYEQVVPAQLSHVRRFISAAATLPIELAHKWQAKYGSVINEGYGLTETCLNTFNHAVRYQPGSIGSPQAGIALRIVANDGKDAPLSELGEVAVQGPNVMLGYWNRPKETAQVLRDGWFHTGDIGRMDADGYCYIVDRVKDMINVGGTKVYPSEVENVLYQHPAVVEAAVYGSADVLFGEQVCATIVLRAGQTTTSAELMTFCGHHLADFKVPTIIQFSDNLPKSRTGKILKRVLREQVTVSHEQQIRHQQPVRQSQEAIQAWIIDWLDRELELSNQSYDLERPFAEVGLTPPLVMNLMRSLSDWLAYPLLPILASNSPTAATLINQLVDEGKSATQSLQTLSSEERIALLEKYLRMEIAHLLHLPSSAEIDRHDNLFRFGFDSLMTVRLKNKMQADLSCVLPPTLLFNYSTLATLTTYLDRIISQGQLEPAALPLVKVDRSQPLPLSLTQQRLWFNQTVNRANSYTIISPFRLEGKLDLRALEQSINALIERHEILRTVFPSINGTPFQVITEALPIKLDPIDLQDLSATEQTSAIEQLIQQEVQHLYDLATGPLVRITLARLANESHVILFSFNHILIDAGSQAQIFDELAILYNSLTTGVASPLPALSLQYADYAYWQRQTLMPAILESRVKYWLQRLIHDTPLFELYSDKPRPTQETFRSCIIPFQATMAQTEQLKTFQKSSGTTLFNSILAVWTALLYRYGQGEELVVGSPFSNRTHQELDGVIGHWGSMLLLPVNFQGRPTFLELIQQVKQAIEDALANEVPVDQLVEALPPTRKRNNLPHQFLLSFAPVNPTNNLKLLGVTVTPIKPKTSMVRPDMIFMVWEDQNSSGSALVGHWVYKMELFEEAYIARMMEDFHSLLDALLIDPTCVISDVQLPRLSTEKVQRMQES